MAFGFIDSGAWHERIERELRGRTSGAKRDYLHHCVKLVFSHLDRRWAVKGYQAYELLETYEAFLALFPHCQRQEEALFHDMIREFRLVMAERLNNQIPCEMHPTFNTRSEDAYDRFTLFGNT